MKKAFFIVVVLCLCALCVQAQSTPCPSGDTCSGSVTFTVTFQSPSSPASVAPSSVVAGAGATLITLAPTSGNTFNSSMVILLCQQTPAVCTSATQLTTTLSSGNLTATIPATTLASSGTIAVYIGQPNTAHAANLQWVPGSGGGAPSSYSVLRGAVSSGPTQRSPRRPLPLPLTATQA